MLGKAVYGEYRPATWGYYGGDPPEYPEVESDVEDKACLDGVLMGDFRNGPVAVYLSKEVCP